MWGGGREDMGNPKYMLLFSLWHRRQDHNLECVWSGEEMGSSRNQ